MITPICAGLVLALASPPAEAAHQLVQSARSGKRAIIAYNWSFVQGAPVCLPGPRPNVEFVSPPAFGTLRILRGSGTVFERDNQCYGRQAESVGITYTSRPGFFGTDGFTIIWVFANGRQRRSTYRFPVR